MTEHAPQLTFHVSRFTFHVAPSRRGGGATRRLTFALRISALLRFSDFGFSIGARICGGLRSSSSYPPGRHYD
ncbi:MAG: hypothetical protein WCK27_19120 [Verrucomicrobiota bacterium]